MELALTELQKPLFRFALQLAGDPHQAADLTQESLCKAWEHRDKLRESTSLKPWLFRIAVNLARDGFRHRSLHETESSVETIQARGASVEEMTAAGELKIQIKEAFEMLPPRQRQVLHLRVVEELSPAAIAEVLGLAPQLVRSNLAAARKRMRSELAATLEELKE